jgi:hypothetical protein
MSATHLQYAYHREGGYAISRRGDELAWPIMDFAGIGKNGDYKAPIKYDLKKIPVLEVGREWSLLVFTRFLPVAHKNLHREFWGLKPLPEEPLARTIDELCADHKVTIYYAHPNGQIGVRHGSWGTGVRLYHWFKKTRNGFVLAHITDNVDDDHKAAIEKRLVRKPASAAVTRY